MIFETTCRPCLSTSLNSLLDRVCHSHSADQVPFVICASGLIGFVLGAFCYQHIHVVVEPSQVLAGVVQYPAPNPFFIYQIKLWSILNQFGAFLMYLGVSEKNLCIVFSGLAGMLTTQALTLAVWAFCRNTFLSLSAPFLIIYSMGGIFHGIDKASIAIMGPNKAAVGFMGPTYPILLFGQEHTYGMIGLAYSLLVISLFGTDRIKLALLLLGLSVAVHPSWGVWLNLVTVAAIAFTWTTVGRSVAVHWRFYVLGLLFSGLSLFWNLNTFHGTYQFTQSSDNRMYVEAFLRHWDAHRGFTEIDFIRMLPLVPSSLLYISLLIKSEPKLPDNLRFMLISFMATLVIGTIGLLMAYAPVGLIPKQIIALMPSRALNLAILSWPLILIGALDSYRTNMICQMMLVACMASILFTFHLVNLISFSLITVVFVLVVSFRTIQKHLLKKSFSPNLLSTQGCQLSPRPYDHKRPDETSIANFMDTFFPKSKAPIMTSRIVWQVGLVIIVLLGVNAAYHSGLLRAQRLEDMFQDHVIAAATSNPGIILTSSNLRRIQLLTRRPVLLDGALDYLPYFPQAGPEMNRILERIYGVSLFDPPEEIRIHRSGSMVQHTGKDLWESRSAEQWQDLANEFEFTNILTYSGWTLNLPVVSSSEKYTLYALKNGPKKPNSDIDTDVRF